MFATMELLVRSAYIYNCDVTRSKLQYEISLQLCFEPKYWVKLALLITKYPIWRVNWIMCRISSQYTNSFLIGSFDFRSSPDSTTKNAATQDSGIKNGGQTSSWKCLGKCNSLELNLSSLLSHQSLNIIINFLKNPRHLRSQQKIQSQSPKPPLIAISTRL